MGKWLSLAFTWQLLFYSLLGDIRLFIQEIFVKMVHPFLLISSEAFEDATVIAKYKENHPTLHQDTVFLIY